MTLEERTRALIEKTRALDGRFGRSAASSFPEMGPAARIITDQPAIWKALIAPAYLPGVVAGPPFEAGGGDCDLFQLWVYDRLRVTAHMRGEELAVRLYAPGAWEPIFFVGSFPDTSPILPGDALNTLTARAAAY